MPPNFSLSCSVLESALMTRMPVMSSCTVRTMRSPFFCTARYIGTLFLVMRKSGTATTGMTATSTSASLALSRKQNNSPPASRMGALTPMRMVRATI